MSVARFSSDLLHDKARLKAWFREPAHLDNLKKSYEATGPRLLADKWQIHWISFLSTFHAFITSGVLKTLHRLCKEVGWHSCKRLMKVAHLHLNKEQDKVSAIKTHQAALISFSRNCPHLYSSDIYLEPSIKLASIQDPHVRALTYGYPKVKLFHKHGECKGMCFWFVYLYLSCKEKFLNPHSHVLAVAKQFEEGAPTPAIVLQSLWLIESLLGIEGTRKSVSLEKFEKALPKFAKKPPGLYSIGVGNHRINYIKISEEEAYLFDPNFGTWHIPYNQAAQAHSYICKLTRESYKKICEGITKHNKGLPSSKKIPFPENVIDIAHCTRIEPSA